jgi:hypothetical protein
MGRPNQRISIFRIKGKRDHPSCFYAFNLVIYLDKELLKYTGVDARLTGFRSDTTTSRGFWPGLRTEEGWGAATATPNSSRIGQTSWTHIGKYLLYLDHDTFSESD